MDHFQIADARSGVAETFVAMGLIYFCFMMFGALTVRVPPPGWKPAGVRRRRGEQLVTTPPDVTADEAIKTPQFWLLWAVLFLNVTAGIGVLGQASPMIQEMFPGASRPRRPRPASSACSACSTWPAVSVWSSLSDYIGRKTHLRDLLPARRGPVRPDAADRAGWAAWPSSCSATASS